MKATIRLLLLVTAAVLLAAAFVGAVQKFGIQMDLLSHVAGAAILVAVVFVLGKEEEG